METCHDSDSTTIVLNIIRSSVGRFCIRKCTIGAPCYIKEFPKVRLVSSVPLVTSTCFIFNTSKLVLYSLKIKASMCLNH